MKKEELIKIIGEAAEPLADTEKASLQLEEGGVSFDFSPGFEDRLAEALSETKEEETIQVDFTSSLNRLFYRIAFTGVAAIVVLMISIFLMEGNVSFNSFLGLGDTYDESIICLLTGN